jgi:hypothetical protein
MVILFVIDEFPRKWKEAVVVYFKELSWRLLGGQKSHKKYSVRIPGLWDDI